MTVALLLSLAFALVGVMIIVYVLVQGTSALQKQDGAPSGLKPGARMPDDTIYVGMSPDTHVALFVMPHDLDRLVTWHDASSCATNKLFGGHTDWRLPTRTELELLHRHRRVIGGFQKGSYWSSTEESPQTAWSQLFMNGYQSFHYKTDINRVRYVRTAIAQT